MTTPSGSPGGSALPVTALVAAFGLWTQLAHGNDWTWLVLGVAVVAQLSAVMLVWSRGGDGWAFVCTATVVAAVVVLLFGSLYPNLVPSTLNPDWSLTIHNASSSPYTLKIMSWAALIFAPLVMATRAGRIGCSGNASRPTGSRRDRPVEAKLSESPRTLTRCGAILAASAGLRRRSSPPTAIASVRAPVAHLLAGIITDPASRTLGHWSDAAVDSVGAVDRSRRRARGCRPG